MDGHSPSVSKVRSYGFCTNPLGQVKDLLRLDTTAAATAEALRDAGLTPQDVQVAEVHDCFTIAELMMYEAIGWAEQGQGIDLVLSGRTSIEAISRSIQVEAWWVSGIL